MLGEAFSAADVSVLPRLLKGPQNHVLSTNAQAAAFPLVIAYVDRLTRLPAFCAGRVQTWLFWRPGILPKYVVPFLELAGNWRNHRYGPSVTRFPARFVDAAVADASAADEAAKKELARLTTEYALSAPSPFPLHPLTCPLMNAAGTSSRRSSSNSGRAAAPRASTRTSRAGRRALKGQRSAWRR